MLSLLKQYIKEIKSAQLKVNKTSATASEDLATIERVYCQKLAKELANMTAGLSATPTTETQTTATLSIDRQRYLNELTTAVESNSLPTLEYLKELDFMDSTIIDDYVTYDKTKCVTGNGNDGYVDCGFKKNGSCYATWLIKRGFCTDNMLSFRMFFDITIAEALYSQGY